MNFLDETKKQLTALGKKPEDIIFIGSVYSGHSCSWEEFLSLANFTYDNSFGGQIIPSDLVIAFSDGSWLSRGEYDGSEWWDYNVPFVVPAETKPINTLQSDTYWITLEQVNEA